MRRRVAWMSMAMCLGFSLSGMAASPFNGLGRYFGWGWSDGYHVASSNLGYCSQNASMPDPYVAPYGGMPAAPYGGMPAAPYGGMPAAPYGGMPAAPISQYPQNSGAAMNGSPRNNSPAIQQPPSSGVYSQGTARVTSLPMTHRLPRVSESPRNEFPSVSVP